MLFTSLCCFPHTLPSSKIHVEFLSSTVYMKISIYILHYLYVIIFSLLVRRILFFDVSFCVKHHHSSIYYYLLEYIKLKQVFPNDTFLLFFFCCCVVIFYANNNRYVEEPIFVNFLSCCFDDMMKNC